jgi:hypothetical protein
VDEIGLRLLLFANVVIPFVFFMAAVYLALHILFARLVASPGSPVVWFFGVVTGPLTRPVRAWLAPGSPESKVRLLALGVYVALWLASRAFFIWLSGHRQG